jgi:transposase
MANLRYGVSADQFVLAWMEVYRADGTAEDVAARLKVPVDTVYARGSAYRSQGLLLPPLCRKPRTRTVDVPKLNKMIANLKIVDASRPARRTRTRT